jgi:tRNA dimethylallyltransferase
LEEYKEEKILISQEKIPLIAVVGPTATGKTRLAIEIAKKYNGEVVSADSMQIYKGMDIATAKPDAEEKQGIKHHLIDFVNIYEKFDVASYCSIAKKCIKDINSKGKIAILAGGTGLYVDSLINNVQFSKGDIDESLRAKLFEESKLKGNIYIWQQLNEIDPLYASSVEVNNIKKIIRGIEIYNTTGITPSEQMKISKSEESPYKTLLIGLNYKDRKILYNKINTRVDKMVEKGLINEARYILKNNHSITSIGAIGYRQLKPYFDNKISFEEAVSNIKRDSRRYAKRQNTWFKRNKNINWIYVDEYCCFDKIIKRSLVMVDNFLN